MNQKGIVLLYILVVLLVITGGLAYYYLNHQTQFNPTASTSNFQSLTIPKASPTTTSLASSTSSSNISEEQLPPLCPDINQWDSPEDDPQHPFRDPNSNNFINKDAILIKSSNAPSLTTATLCMEYYHNWFESHGWTQKGFASGPGVTGTEEYTRNNYYFEFGEHEGLWKKPDGTNYVAFFVEYNK